MFIATCQKVYHIFAIACFWKVIVSLWFIIAQAIICCTRYCGITIFIIYAVTVTITHILYNIQIMQ